MTNVFSREVKDVTCLLLDGLGSPFALAAKKLVVDHKWNDLAALAVDPRSYTSALPYFLDVQASAFLKKYSALPNDVDRKAVAVEKWWKGEHDCYRSNERLSPYLSQHTHACDREEMIDDFLSSVRRIVLDWIGPTPPRLAAGRFGPGATFSDRGRKTTVPDKISADPSLTSDAIWHLPQWLGTQWGSAFAARQGELSFVRGNRFTTVPKTSLTDRSIGAEPGVNVFYQLAYGRVIRQRLRAVGWDLDKAQDEHRKIAQTSSVSREFATLDLSNASDTVCINLVKLILPSAWFEVLDDLRSKATLMPQKGKDDGKWVRLEKFSSMGNGFTFELETLIFAALCCASLRKEGRTGRLGEDVFVFGDDIIVPTMAVRPVISVLKFFGFKLNEEKSFFGDEPFRESCGGDFYNGFPVRPFSLRDEPKEPSEWISLHNGVFRIIEALNGAGGSHWDLSHVLRYILQRLPNRIRSCRGPKALGDIVLWEEDSSLWRTRWEDGIRYVRSWMPDKYRLVRYDRFHGDVVLACATYMLGGSHLGGVIPRDGLMSMEVGWVAYS